MDFTEVYKKHYGWVFERFSSRYSIEQAHDCTQEVFLMLHKMQDRYNPQFAVATFLGLLCNNVHDDVSRLKRIQTSSLDIKVTSTGEEVTFLKDDIPDDNAGEVFEICNRAFDLHKMIDRLDVNLTSKALLRMSLIENKAPIEMQAATGKDAMYVRRTRIRAMRALADSVGVDF